MACAVPESSTFRSSTSSPFSDSSSPSRGMRISALGRVSILCESCESLTSRERWLKALTADKSKPQEYLLVIAFNCIRSLLSTSATCTSSVHGITRALGCTIALADRTVDKNDEASMSIASESTTSRLGVEPSTSSGAEGLCSGSPPLPAGRSSIA